MNVSDRAAGLYPRPFPLLQNDLPRPGEIRQPGADMAAAFAAIRHTAGGAASGTIGTARDTSGAAGDTSGTASDTIGTASGTIGTASGTIGDMRMKRHAARALSPGTASHPARKEETAPSGGSLRVECIDAQDPTHEPAVMMRIKA
jgi:hypothetical protein